MADRRTRRRKRQRFLPFFYRRHGFEASIRRVMLDGAAADETVDRERRVVALHEDTWEMASLELELDLSDELLRAVVSTPELEGRPPLELIVALRCAATRLRRSQAVRRVSARAERYTAGIDVRRADVCGAAELSAHLVRSRDATTRAPGFAWAAGSRLASARSWELRFEPRRVSAGRFLDVRYRSFREDEVLSAHPGNVYRLELDDEVPVLWVNTDHERLTPILSDKGSTGKRARLREVFFDMIAHGVWPQLFIHAAERLRTDGELTYDWQDAVLRELLPLMLAGHRNHQQRVRALERALERDGLPSVMERLDAALQRRSDISRHMNRLVAETVEGKSR